MKGPTVNLLLKGVPAHIRDRFKAECAARGLTMKYVLVQLMRKYANLKVSVKPPTQKPLKRKKRKRRRNEVEVEI